MAAIALKRDEERQILEDGTLALKSLEFKKIRDEETHGGTTIKSVTAHFVSTERMELELVVRIGNEATAVKRTELAKAAGLASELHPTHEHGETHRKIDMKGTPGAIKAFVQQDEVRSLLPAEAVREICVPYGHVVELEDITQGQYAVASPLSRAH